jgi:predicted PurR-regulated permease PerM
MNDASQRSLCPYEITSWVLAALALFGVLWFNLLPALLSGLLVYELVHVLAPPLARRVFGGRAKLVVVILLATLIVSAIGAALFGLSSVVRIEAGGYPSLLGKMAEILDGYRSSLPAWLAPLLPANADAMKDVLVDWLRRHADAVQLFSKEAGRVLVHILIGMIIGAIISLREALPPTDYKPLARALNTRALALADAFRRMVFAQVRISALNTLFTGIYLTVVLPAFGVNLELKKTMIAVTFIAGLLPVIGNLISNSVIVVISLSHSLHIVVASLLFLILIHKLEYFLNARIIGGQINAHAWELLIAMLAMEAAFGLPGVVAAPIYYAYLKQALAERGLV